jgi:hypothetical protein
LRALWGNSIEEHFAKEQARENNTSLAGVVFARTTILTSRNGDASRHFDSTTISKVVKTLRPSPFITDLARVTAFGATSVNSPQEREEPYGVIVLWKRGWSRHSISEYDEAAMITAARVLSGVTTYWTDHDRYGKRNFEDADAS